MPRANPPINRTKLLSPRQVTRPRDIRIKLRGGLSCLIGWLDLSREFIDPVVLVFLYVVDYTEGLWGLEVH